MAGCEYSSESCDEDIDGSSSSDEAADSRTNVNSSNSSLFNYAVGAPRNVNRFRLSAAYSLTDIHELATTMSS